VNEPIPAPSMILRAKNGIKLKFYKRV